jgi:DNA-binding NarL/FixJ family response regulator
VTEQAESSTPTGRTADRPVGVFLLDDHEIVRRGLRELLESDGTIQVIGESGSAREAARRIPALRPDVAILDGRLPDGTGMDVCRDVRSLDPGIACLILTSYDDDEALVAAIMAGAAGYVLKQIRGTELLTAVHRVAQGQSLIDPQLMQRVVHRIREQPEQDPALASLTDQERRILLLIAEGLTNRQIAERLFISPKTAGLHVSNILGKLKVANRTQAAEVAHRARAGTG